MGKFVCNFISYALKRTVDITVVVPTPTIPESFALEIDPSVRVRHTPEHKYPVLYLSFMVAGITTPPGLATPTWRCTPRSSRSLW